MELRWVEVILVTNLQGGTLLAQTPKDVDPQNPGSSILETL